MRTEIEFPYVFCHSGTSSITVETRGEMTHLCSALGGCVDLDPTERAALSAMLAAAAAGGDCQQHRCGERWLLVNTAMGVVTIQALADGDRAKLSMAPDAASQVADALAA